MLERQPVAVFQSFARTNEFSANDHFTQMLFAGDTLKRYGAGPLWAIVPFGPYARQDQEREGRMDSVGCDVAARFLSQDFEGISTIEIHSAKALTILENRFGPGNAFSIDPTDFFVADVKQFSLNQPVVVSPDKGANTRADALARYLGADRFFVDKERREIINTRIAGYHGEVAGRDAVMVDDMADTFGTAEKSARLVREKGASRVFFYAAHPVLSNPAWERLAKLIGDGIIDHVGLGDTVARSAEFENFRQQYGHAVADKISFLATHDLLYRHVKEMVAPHPAMQRKIG
jgi:ribose-phosphate pyrophosphokinase